MSAALRDGEGASRGGAGSGVQWKPGGGGDLQEGSVGLCPMFAPLRTLQRPTRHFLSKGVKYIDGLLPGERKREEYRAEAQLKGKVNSNALLDFW